MFHGPKTPRLLRPDTGKPGSPPPADHRAPTRNGKRLRAGLPLRARARPGYVPGPGYAPGSPTAREVATGVDPGAGASCRIGTSFSIATNAAARSDAPIPMTNVFAVAIENAWWIASTIAGMNGSTWARNAAGTCARIAAPRSPTPVTASGRTPPPASALASSGGTSGGGELPRHLLDERCAEDRAGDRQADGPADLLEERQVAGRGPEPLDRHAVLDDEREHRERRADAEPGRRTSTPTAAGSACRLAGCSAGTARPPSSPARRVSSSL